LRPVFQWKAEFLELVPDLFDRGDIESSQTHFPTTWACSNISGISRPSRSSKSRVGNELASDEFTVTLLLPSTCFSRLLLVWLRSLEARTALHLVSERECIGMN
jgi:hypothetical protein